jgi:hypothetical protein
MCDMHSHIIMYVLEYVFLLHYRYTPALPSQFRGTCVRGLRRSPAPTSQSPVHHLSKSAYASARLKRKADSWRNGRGKRSAMHGKI